MAMSPAYALAHTFLPNWLKLKGAQTVMSALERKDLIYFDPLWQQAYVTFNPHIVTTTRDPYRIAVMTMPPPKEMGEAHMVGIVVQNGQPGFTRYFTLEHDYVLAKQANRTFVCERDGKTHNKHHEGPVLTGDPAADAQAFITSFMPLMSKSTGVVPR